MPVRGVPPGVTPAAVVVGEGHITILGLSYDSIGQGDWVFQPDPLQFLCGYFVNESAEDGDNVSYHVYLDAGTYTLRLCGNSYDGGGILDFDLNGIEIASFDLYSFGTIPNVLCTKTGIIVITPGLYTLKCQLDGKNEASGFYQALIGYIALWRTA